VAKYKIMSVLNIDEQVARAEQVTQTSKAYFASLKSFDDELKANFTRRLDLLGKTFLRS